MAIIKTNYGPTIVIQPFLIRVKKDTNTSEIIIEDMVPTFTSSQRAAINRDEVWIEVQADYTVTVLRGAPTNVTIIDQYNNLSQSLVKVKGGEVFVTEHNSSAPADTNQTTVIGYSFGTFDKVFVKLDRIANTISVYSGTDNS